MRFTAYHGTSYRNALAIVQNGFSVERYPNWTSDLGSGVYGFTEEDTLPFPSAKQNALRYAQLKQRMHGVGSHTTVPHPGDKRLGIVQFKVDVDKSEFCDFNKSENLIRFLEWKLQIAQMIHEPRVFNHGASARDNEDGLILEWLIAHRRFKDFGAFALRTYTPFLAKTSNFPNGREICVRDLTLISDVSLLK